MIYYAVPIIWSFPPPHEASYANYKNKDFVVSFPEDEP